MIKIIKVSNFNYGRLLFLLKQAWGAVKKFINFYDKTFQMLSIWNFWIKIVDWPQDQKPFSFQCMQWSRSETSQPILHNHIKSGFLINTFKLWGFLLPILVSVWIMLSYILEEIWGEIDWSESIYLVAHFSQDWVPILEWVSNHEKMYKCLEGRKEIHQFYSLI